MADRLVFSQLQYNAAEDDLGPWLVRGTDGSDLGDFPGSPLGNFPSGVLSMQRLTNERIAIWAEEFLWTIKQDGTDAQGGTISSDRLGGFSLTHAYLIGRYPTVGDPTFIQEYDLDTMMLTRTWEIATHGQYALFGFGNICVNSTRTIAYYTRNQADDLSSEDFKIIHRWDLTNDTALSDLVTLTHSIGGLSCLQDDNIAIALDVDLARIYAPDGTLIANTNFNDVNSLSHNQGQTALAADATSFWVVGQWYDVDFNLFYRAYEIDSSTGAILTTTDVTDNVHYAWDYGFVFLPDGPCLPACEPCSNGARRVSIFLNGVRQASAQLNSMNQATVTLPFLFEALRNDVVTVRAYQNSGAPISIIPAFQIHRVTYKTHDKAVGRNREETIDPRNGVTSDTVAGCSGGGGGGTGCTECIASDTPPPSGAPAWHDAMLVANGATTCYDPLMVTEATVNAHNLSLERNSAGEFRGRYYEGFPVPNFAHYIDIVRPDCGWGWFPNVEF